MISPAGDRSPEPARLLGSALLLTSAIAAAIAWIAPFDTIFQHLTLGSPLLRACTIALMTVAGAGFSRRLGLRFEGRSVRQTLVPGLLAAVLVAIYVVALDAFLFRGLLLPSYVAFLRTPLPGRMVYFLLRAINENVIYRLFVFTALAAAAAAIMRRQRPPFALALALMVAAQVLNIGVNVVLGSGEPWTAAVLAYDGLRYVAPGVLWACLLWRYGFFAAEVASVGCHLFLQPVLGVLLA